MVCTSKKAQLLNEAVDLIEEVLNFECTTLQEDLDLDQLSCSDNDNNISIASTSTTPSFDNIPFPLTHVLLEEYCSIQMQRYSVP